MLDSYNFMEEKLYHCPEDQSSLENSMKDLKADLTRKERKSEVPRRKCQISGSRKFTQLNWISARRLLLIKWLRFCNITRRRRSSLRLSRELSFSIILLSELTKL